MAFEIKMTEKDNKYDTVVVEKVKIPKGTHIGWKAYSPRKDRKYTICYLCISTDH